MFDRHNLGVATQRKGLPYLLVVLQGLLLSTFLSLLSLPWLNNAIHMKARLKGASVYNLLACTALLLLALVAARKPTQRFIRRYINTWRKLDAPPRSLVDYASWTGSVAL
jgi:hypothetical protein